MRPTTLLACVLILTVSACNKSETAGVASGNRSHPQRIASGLRFTLESPDVLRIEAENQSDKSSVLRVKRSPENGGLSIELTLDGSSASTNLPFQNPKSKRIQVRPLFDEGHSVHLGSYADEESIPCDIRWVATGVESGELEIKSDEITPSDIVLKLKYPEIFYAVNGTLVASRL